MFLKLVNLFEEPLIKTAEIVQKDDKYYVLSEKTGKSLGGPYDTKDEAVKRLGQIHYFKKHAEYKYIDDKGYIYLRPDPAKRENTLAISELYVKPEYRRKGYAKELIEYAKSKDKDLVLRAQPFKDKEVSLEDLKAFYKSQGFSQIEGKTSKERRTPNLYIYKHATLEKTATPSLDVVNDAARNRLLKIVRKLDTIQDSESLNKKIDIDKLDKYIKKSKRQLHNIGNDMATVPAINLTDNYSKFLDLITTKYTYSKDLN